MTVPRLFDGQTIIVAAAGPSLVQADLDLCRGRAPLVVVNDAYRMAMWADVLYACDRKWWNWQVQYHAGDLAAFKGLKFSLRTSKVPDVTVLRETGTAGIELDPGGLKTGRNSGYQAINLALHLGANRILLLGYDMSYGVGGRSHCFGEHRDGEKPPVTTFRKYFRTIAAPLKEAGVEVWNCSRRSALTMFRQVPLSAALKTIRVAA